MLANLLILLVPLASSSAYNNYTHGGSDWTGVCKNGTLQSPINVKYSRAYLPYPGSGVITTDFQNTTLTGNFSDVGLRLFGDFGNFTFISTSGIFTSAVLRMNVFAPSQHYINGKKYSMEITFKLNPQPGYIGTAVSVFFKTGAKNAFIDSVIQHLNNTSDPLVNLASIVGTKISNYYMYEGSYPVPPCSETVQWYILPNINTISSSQLKFFTDNWAGNKTFAGGRGNTRYIQSLNSRTIVYQRGL